MKFCKSLPAEPMDYKTCGKVKIDLEGLDAVTFRSEIGGDYPVEDEDGHRRTIGINKKGKEVNYVTLMETSEKQHLIKTVKAISHKKIIVNTTDNRRIVIEVLGLDSISGKITVSIEEWENGVLLRKEVSVKKA
ncbi:MAG: hypothetical protein ACK5LT_00030 [Lachnospirales bacterium]